MTRVEFRTGVADPLAYAARWLGMAWQRGARVRVLGSAEDLQALDQRLWVADKEGFLPHAFSGPSARRPGMERTTIWLGEGETAGEAPGVLLNLGLECPQDARAYERVLEVVGRDEARVHAGRQRWAQYRRQGLEPTHDNGPSDEVAVP